MAGCAQTFAAGEVSADDELFDDLGEDENSPVESLNDYDDFAGDDEEEETDEDEEGYF